MPDILRLKRCSLTERILKQMPASKKVVKKEIPKAAKIYEKQLMDEVNKGRENRAKKPLDDTKPSETKIENESTIERVFADTKE